MRDALSLTDQAIAYAAGQVTLDAVQGMLGALDQSYLVRLLDALVKQDGADLMAVADEMASRSLSYNGALQDLGTLLHRIALAQTVPAAVPEDLPELADIQRLAAAFDPQEVQLYYQIAVHGRNEIGLAPDEYAGFTMTLLRMLAFRPGQGGAEALPAAEAQRAAAPARAAVAAVASHATVPTRPPAPAVQAAPAAPVAPAAAPAPAARPTTASGPAPAMNSARAAINAALEAARAASRNLGGGKRPPAAAPAPDNMAPPAPEAAAAQPAAPAPAAPDAQPAQYAAAARPMNSAPPAPASAQPAPQGRPASPPSASAPAAPQMRAAAPSPASAPPWDQGQPSAAMRPQAAQAVQYDDSDTLTDEPPSWVTEFSDDSAVASEATPVAAPPAPSRAPAAPAYPYVITPVPAIGWDGNWPALAASLPLRGVSQQLAMQTELIECVADSGSATFRLRVPIDTLRASGNSEKLCAALQERFPSIRVNVDTEIAPVWYTASAEAKAERERRQAEAEATVDADPFVQTMARQFNAFVVPGSVRPKAA
jgi:DNA polymerase-3 subunit gamma/tau